MNRTIDQLIQAAECGDVAALREMLAQSPALAREFGAQGFTTLHITPRQRRCGPHANQSARDTALAPGQAAAGQYARDTRVSHLMTEACAIAGRAARARHITRTSDGSLDVDRLLRTMLSENDIKAELSYAYLHSVAAYAGFACSQTFRHLDNAGVDAQIDVGKRLHPKSVFTTFSLHFQLKATSQELTIVRGHCSYDLEIPHYDKLRTTELITPRFMVLFELPDSAEEWLNVSAEQLVARRCGRWLSLRGAPATENTARIAVHVPMNNVLTPNSLHDIATRISLGEVFEHDA